MIEYFKISLLLIMISFLTCESGSDLWKVQIGYQNRGIFLGDSYEETKRKLGTLKLDVNAENSVDVKNYVKFPNQIEVQNLEINPIIFMKFNRDELVRFLVVYTIDKTLNSINYQNLIEELSRNELTKIDELLNKESKSFVYKQFWFKRIEIDTTSGEYPKIEYRVQAIP